MDPEREPDLPATPPAAGDASTDASTPALDAALTGPEEPYRGLRWIFMGSEGLRAGWSVLVFIALLIPFGMIAGFCLVKTHLLNPKVQFTADQSIYRELIPFLAMLAAAGIVALIEHRRILDYNLRGTRRLVNLLFGIVVGFVALSAQLGAMLSGGWLHFGPVAISGMDIARFGLLWGCAFLLVGCVEEGIFRCYLQFTFTRGLNFWWALGIVAAICLDLVLRGKGNGIHGVYLIALLGLVPCFLLHQRAAASSGFWQAAWVTSTLFGFVHTGNNGENWIGIFSAAAIGFVFCVSVKLTGTAWWAIGAHAGWDWGETFFYGTADSGYTAKGHYLSAMPTGNPFWSGGTDGPEGSVLVLGAILLMLAILLFVYGRRKAASAQSYSVADS